ncbi:hypothetical protein L1887_47724 [Cichorium endivia]|nr:hypothetical protein L1887_47724 [Cichorium endivia]
MPERATPELPVDMQLLPLASSQLRAAVLLGALATIRTGLTARIGDTRGRTVARAWQGPTASPNNDARRESQRRTPDASNDIYSMPSECAMDGFGDVCSGEADWMGACLVGRFWSFGSLGIGARGGD